MRPEKAARELDELRLLRKVAAKIPEYTTDNVRVLVEFRDPPQSHAVRLKLNETAMAIVRNVLTVDEMRARMAARVSGRISALEAKYPGLVD